MADVAASMESGHNGRNQYAHITLPPVLSLPQWSPAITAGIRVKEPT